MSKKLYRIKEGKMIGGVCNGVAEYFDVDVTIVRIAWAVFTLCYGFGLLAYILCLLFAPEK